MLDVSVDAIGKYERSVSFIRGDLEHRLAERLGWSRDNILACRRDWDARRAELPKGDMRLLDESAVTEYFDGSLDRVVQAMLDMVASDFRALPEILRPARETWLPIYRAFPQHWAAVMKGERIIAKWALPFLGPEDEADFREGCLMEAELTAERLHRPLLPGSYFGYCPALYVHPGHEAAASLLLTAFVRFLEDLAAREVLLHGIGTISVSPSGERLCQDLGMRHLCAYRTDPDFGVWELPGAAIPASIFGRRSPRLRQAYGKAFG